MNEAYKEFDLELVKLRADKIQLDVEVESNLTLVLSKICQSDLFFERTVSDNGLAQLIS